MTYRTCFKNYKVINYQLVVVLKLISVIWVIIRGKILKIAEWYTRSLDSWIITLPQGYPLATLTLDCNMIKKSIYLLLKATKLCGDLSLAQ
jgi:hypothetical protein